MPLLLQLVSKEPPPTSPVGIFPCPTKCIVNIMLGGPIGLNQIDKSSNVARAEAYYLANSPPLLGNEPTCFFIFVHFTMDSMRVEPTRFTGLPLELLGEVVSHLPNRGIKSLRLASTYFYNVTYLRLDWVFLSLLPATLRFSGLSQTTRPSATILWKLSTMMCV